MTNPLLKQLMALVLCFSITMLAPAGLMADDKKKDPDQIGERDVDGSVNFYSLEKEIALGKQLATEVERQAKIIDDPIVSEYVNRIGQNLVRNSDVKVPVSIKVIDDDSVNAFALPGGFFFVNTGLMLRADNEAELAGVMGHELAQIAARHGTRQATRGQIINFATIPLLFVGGWTGYAIRQGLGFAIPLQFLSFSRGFEKEADILGIQYMYKAGYDPTSYVTFFEKMQALEKRKPGALSKVFRSHPLTDDRIEVAQSMIEEFLKEKPEYVLTTSEFDKVKARLAKVVNNGGPIEDDPNRPTLRRAPGSDTIEMGDEEGSEEERIDDDDRPTLKRRN
jgi:predicted Zn-dependent protease